jgi:ABC-type sugar transport system substrate-binding protein
MLRRVTNIITLSALLIALWHVAGCEPGASQPAPRSTKPAIAVIGFDEQDDTLQGIEDGEVYGTISQQPFNYGYQSVRVCKALIDGDTSVIPKNGIIDMPLMVVKKDNVQKFREDLKAALASVKKSGDVSANTTEKPAGDQTPTAGKKAEIAFVTNGIDPFWDIAAAGAQKAAADLGVNVRILMPPNGVADQTRMVQEMITIGVNALAISPIDKVNENDLINEAAAKMPVITFDSDAPDSNRKLFLGVNNLKAGREVGKLVKEAVPDGGEVMIFIGRLDQLNAVQRTQGTIDELLGLPAGETAMDDPTRNYTKQNLKAGKYTVLDVRTDQFDKARAKQVVEDALTRNPNIRCMIGLFAYNPPAILNVLRDAGRLGK